MTASLAHSRRLKARWGGYRHALGGAVLPARLAVRARAWEGPLSVSGESSRADAAPAAAGRPPPSPGDVPCRRRRTAPRCVVRWQVRLAAAWKGCRAPPVHGAAASAVDAGPLVRCSAQSAAAAWGFFSFPVNFCGGSAQHRASEWRQRGVGPVDMSTRRGKPGRQHGPSGLPGQNDTTAVRAWNGRSRTWQRSPLPLPRPPPPPALSLDVSAHLRADQQTSRKKTAGKEHIAATRPVGAPLNPPLPPPPLHPSSYYAPPSVLPIHTPTRRPSVARAGLAWARQGDVHARRTEGRSQHRSRRVNVSSQTAVAVRMCTCDAAPHLGAATDQRPAVFQCQAVHPWLPRLGSHAPCAETKRDNTSPPEHLTSRQCPAAKSPGGLPASAATMQ